jgi:hypothetical protein
MIAGLAAIFARIPRWTVAIAGIVSAFAIGAASAVAVGLYQTSIFIAYDVVYDEAGRGLHGYAEWFLDRGGRTQTSRLQMMRSFCFMVI